MTMVIYDNDNDNHYNDITYNYICLYDMKIGLDFHFFL